MSAAVELRGVVALAGMKPLTASLRMGEVVRVDGPAPAVSALLDAIAGRRRPRAGLISLRGSGRVLVRAGERSPPAVDAHAAIALWAALAGAGGASAGSRHASIDLDPAARGSHLIAPLWLVDGALAEATETIVQRGADAVRAGDGLMVWTGGTGRDQVDRVLVVELDGEAHDAGRRGAFAASGDRPARPWRAIARFAAAAASARAAIAVAIVAALWIAAAAATIAAHESFWYSDGSASANLLLARIGALGAVIAAATAAAARAGAAIAWPAMIRETGAGPGVRTAALAAADVGGAAFAAGVAALPAVWAHEPFVAVTASFATLVAAACASAVTRSTRGASVAGALLGAGVGAALLW